MRLKRITLSFDFQEIPLRRPVTIAQSRITRVVMPVISNLFLDQSGIHIQILLVKVLSRPLTMTIITSIQELDRPFRGESMSQPVQVSVDREIVEMAPLAP